MAFGQYIHLQSNQRSDAMAVGGMRRPCPAPDGICGPSLAKSDSSAQQNRPQTMENPGGESEYGSAFVARVSGTIQNVYEDRKVFWL